MLRSSDRQRIPELTKLVAQAAFPTGTIVTVMRDELGPLFEDETIKLHYPTFFSC